MRTSRCAAKCDSHCQHSHAVSRRRFVKTASASVVSASLLGSLLANQATTAEPAEKMKPNGPAAKYVPTIKACFIRRKGEYGKKKKHVPDFDLFDQRAPIQDGDDAPGNSQR